MSNEIFNNDFTSVIGEKAKKSAFYNRIFKIDTKEKFNWNRLNAPSENNLQSLSDLPNIDKRKKKHSLDRLAVCKLNGGLGTSMGCKGPKSLIEIRGNHTFLGITVRQIVEKNREYGVDIPLFLMNSFHTDSDTRGFLKQYAGKLTCKTFCQNKFFRLRRDSMLPLKKSEFGEDAYYPPGHGDFYSCLYESGILERLIESGKEYMFTSNIDNLGSVIDERIPHFMRENGVDFLCEVAEKTRNDVKGGTFVQDIDGTMRLLEMSQVPQKYRREFENINRFKLFNTNNIWINLRALKSLMDANALTMDLIFNQKQVNGIGITQIEIAIASAIRSFKKKILLNVDRLRFIPVKKTEDLLLVKSTLFYEKNNLLYLDAKRQSKHMPLVRLGERYKTVNDLLLRMPDIPDISELDLLTVVGNVHFGINVTLIANVIITCTGDVLHIPDNTVLNNKVVHGALNISDL